MLQIIRRFVILETLDPLSWGEVSFVSNPVLHYDITDSTLMDDVGDKYLENRLIFWEYIRVDTHTHTHHVVF